MCKRVAGSGLGLGLFERRLHAGQSCCRRLVRAKVSEAKPLFMPHALTSVTPSPTPVRLLSDSWSPV
eukprot:1146676-Pelagomonas_calceolata.AAC.2